MLRDASNKNSVSELIMHSIQEWKSLPEVKKNLKMSPEEIVTVSINRDPMRVIHYDKNYFLSPADGFILYSKIVDPDDEILRVKGGTYSVNTLLREQMESPSLVIGIFMTAYDVHINRIPTNGFVTYEKLLPLKVFNLSMREVEHDILDRLRIREDQLKYAFYNERTLNKIFCPWINQHYYILQIADFEVDVIVPFEDQNYFYTQGERFSLVRLGSQVDLVIPLAKDVHVESLVDGKELWHVEAGTDKLVKILR